jgi:hypothetical protein
MSAMVALTVPAVPATLVASKPPWETEGHSPATVKADSLPVALDAALAQRHVLTIPVVLRDKLLVVR